MACGKMRYPWRIEIAHVHVQMGPGCGLGKAVIPGKLGWTAVNFDGALKGGGRK
jgi:hypothetical protein